MEREIVSGLSGWKLVFFLADTDLAAILDVAFYLKGRNRFSIKAKRKTKVFMLLRKVKL